MQCFYSKSSPHEGMKDPLHRVTLGVLIQDAGKLRHALGLPQGGPIRVALHILPDGVVLKHDDSGSLMQPKVRGKTLEVTFTERSKQKVSRLPDAAKVEVKHAICDDGLRFYFPENPVPPRRRTYQGKRNWKPRTLTATAVVLMEIENRQLTFNVPLGEAFDQAVEWAQYKE